MGEERVTRYDALAKPLKTFFIVVCTAGMGLAVYYIFGFCIGGFTFLNAGYYYLLFGLYGSCVFLILPENKRVQWYDLVLSALFLAIAIYFFSNAMEIVTVGWVPASTFDVALACIFLLICLEACRRVTGFGLPAVAVILGLYPLIAGHMPGVLEGVSHPFSKAVALYAFGGEGVIGLPGAVLGGVLIGFLIFSGFLIATGAGEFFLNAAFALLGRYRGGPAKVAVVASGFFGSLSGSALSNIAATGSITIPAMKRTGFQPHYAGAIEACASTGGVLMPPVMGAIAFVMCALLEMPYYTIVLAALVPAILYYFGLLVQVDAYAARVGIKGLPKEAIPSLRGVLKRGWPFVAVFFFLIWGLLYMRWEFLTPFYASALLLLLSFSSRETMMTPRRLVRALVTVGKLVTITVAIFLPFGIIMSAITITGVAHAFTAGSVGLGGGNVFLIMVLGVVSCYIMGMAGVGIAAYVFLGIALAPAMILMGGLNTLAVHLFIMYYAMLALITPPVASAAFLGASIAGAPAMRTAFTSMRLGVVIYFVPFFFVMEPALILQGPILETLYLFVLCLLGIFLIGSGVEGYLLKMGRLDWWARPLLIVGGFLIAFPRWNTTFIGAVLALLAITILIILKRRKEERRGIRTNS